MKLSANLTGFNIFNLLILCAVVLLNSACIFPDNILNWQDISNYKLGKIKFGKTTIDEFEKLIKDTKSEKVGSNIVIFSAEPADKTTYKKIRVGFKDKKLDWIEFILNKDIGIAQITDIYGKPRDINSKYSKTLDYYDYGFFNVSTDKNHSSAKTVTIFELPSAVAEAPELEFLIPSWQNINTINFLNLKPGKTLESEFNKLYPDLTSVDSGKGNTTSTYIIDKELGRSKLYYKKAVLTFNNGLLNWISLIPQNLPLKNALNKYKSGYKVEPIDSKYDFYDFSNFIMVVDKTQNKVVNIGILSAQ